MADYEIWRYPRNAAVRAVQEGIPAPVALQVLQALGAEVNPDTWYQLYGQEEVRKALVGPTGELELDELPGEDLIQTRSTVTAEGYQVQLIVSAIDETTGADREIPYTLDVESPITPGAAIEQAIADQTIRVEGSKLALQIIDARVTGYYRNTPGAGL